MRRRPLLVALMTLSAACAGAGRTPPRPLPPRPTPHISGLFEGMLRIEGDSVLSALQLTQDDVSFRSRLTAPEFGMDARGSGRIEGSAMELALTYGSRECAGTAKLLGHLDPEARSYSGTIVASDCTGDVQGTFRFGPPQTR